MAERLKPREQGDLGELSAMEWFASKGAKVAIPVFHSPDVDLYADFGERLLRVQVKTSAHQSRGR
jgi:Holliday junction resolvase-like predicted endonuclease